MEYTKNTFTIPANIISGGYREMWLFINFVPMDWIYEIDNKVMVPADNEWTMMDIIFQGM